MFFPKSTYWWGMLTCFLHLSYSFLTTYELRPTMDGSLSVVECSYLDRNLLSTISKLSRAQTGLAEIDYWLKKEETWTLFSNWSKGKVLELNMIYHPKLPKTRCSQSERNQLRQAPAPRHRRLPSIDNQPIEIWINWRESRRCCWYHRKLGRG